MTTTKYNEISSNKQGHNKNIDNYKNNNNNINNNKFNNNNKRRPQIYFKAFFLFILDILNYFIWFLDHITRTKFDRNDKINPHLLLDLIELIHYQHEYLIYLLLSNKTWSNSNLSKSFVLGSLESLKFIFPLQRAFSLKVILGQKKIWV